jgi:propionyl-CoA carboxylase alpha chain
LITKVLIANRGEIAVRIARTCRSMGIATVAVFSDADAGSVHVAACDEALRLGGATPAESYLRADALVDAARRTGADAVHPGYGFLAENASFAAAVRDAGLTWVGPSPDAIAAMGDKLEAKRRMEQAGVPLLPGATITGDTDLAAVASELGFPLMVKAAAGGGGKGMRVVHDAAALADAVAGAAREAEGAFGDGRVFLERFVARPRHIEVQILGDEHGTLLHLFERECSIQRRHQKVIEESPAPTLDEDLRARICDAALTAGRAIGYSNAGTVEFICWSSTDGPRPDRFAFLEVNTRLQVEHPVTELVTGLDLVRLQLLVAAGEPLPLTQQDVQRAGHAIEARLYAEDPVNDYLPVTGRLHTFVPAHVDGVRYDSGVASGSDISPHYDPMLAKVIAHGPTRTEAAARLATALERTVVHGPTSNRDLLVAVLRDPGFLDGDTTTAFLDERFASADDRGPRPDPATVRLAVVVATALARRDRRRAAVANATVPGGFTNDPHARWSATFVAGDHTYVAAYRWQRDGGIAVEVDGHDHHVLVGPGDVVEVDGHRMEVGWFVDDRTCHVVLPSAAVDLTIVPRFPERMTDVAEGATVAPMPGTVVEVTVEPGDEVAAGTVMVTLEAMKMEHRIVAPVDGTVHDVKARSGDAVSAGDVLVVVTPAD